MSNISDYVEQLKTTIDELAKSVENTAENLSSNNTKVAASLESMNRMNVQIQDIRQQVDTVFADIDTQMLVTKDFTRQIENLSENYGRLSEDCIQSGKHIFQIGRYLDKTRSDLVRGCSAITQQDWMKVFDVDHFVLTWRIYNNIVGFEHLRKEQVDNPEGCKLGKWLTAQTNTALAQCNEFRRLKEVHDTLHKYAALSWTANEEGNQEEALSYFRQTYSAYESYTSAIKALQRKMQSLGYQEQTDFQIFQQT